MCIPQEDGKKTTGQTSHAYSFQTWLVWSIWMVWKFHRKPSLSPSAGFSTEASGSNVQCCKVKGREGSWQPGEDLVPAAAGYHHQPQSLAEPTELTLPYGSIETELQARAKVRDLFLNCSSQPDKLRPKVNKEFGRFVTCQETTLIRSYFYMSSYLPL